MSVFQAVPDHISFPKAEEDIAAYWKDIDAFQTSLKKSEGRPEYSFYDGPPFATGLPHYGHILAGTIKDIVTRYYHQQGFHIVRRFGWDCHGLPVEFEIDQALNIKSPEDVEKIGIDVYNAECRKIVMRYSKEWETVVTRCGRWIDFQNDYKTLDTSFMESVWWVFKQLHEKDLVYQGVKVMPFSTACNTPISNFEANLNYKNVSDPAIIISFPIIDEPDTQIVAWTTTPWTLISNLALAVKKDMDYVKVLDKKLGFKLIMAEARLSELYRGPGKKKGKGKPQEPEYEILERFKGEALIGKKYEPLFHYFDGFAKKHDVWRVIGGDFVTDDSGTGVVHIAPFFGEDDFKVGQSEGIVFNGGDTVCPVDTAGRFTSEVPDYAGRYIKDCDKDIIEDLKKRGRLLHKGSIVHSYPFCWRSETPLIYRAIPSWFVRVESMRDRLCKNNLLSRWVPAIVQEKRFHNWLADARDWVISRNRFWGTPLPIWTSKDGTQIKVIGSVEELETLTGAKVTDLHRDHVDHLEIADPRGVDYPPMKRVSEVFDCWFESGSMPYAQVHYPFENQKLFKESFPADFIAEGLDQTRGWFYTLLVLSTAIFEKPAFKNLIVNGLVLAEDGKKMSKRLKNYPDPIEVIDALGADPLRLYLINSPVVRAEPLRFRYEGVRDVVKSVLLPWYNSYKFFVNNAIRCKNEDGSAFVPSQAVADSSSNVMDHWITSASNSLIAYMSKEMEGYRLYTVVPFLLKFVDTLTNWYIRLNRPRLKGNAGEVDMRQSLSRLYYVLYELCILMAPFTPFLSETMYQNLKRGVPKEEQEDSVHYLMYPKATLEVDPVVERRVARMIQTIELGRGIRDRTTMPVKIPLRTAVIAVDDKEFLADVETMAVYIKDELNVKELVYEQEPTKFVTLAVEPVLKKLGPRLGKAMGKVVRELKALSTEQIMEAQTAGHVVCNGERVTMDELRVVAVKKEQGLAEGMEAATVGNVVLLLRTVLDDELRGEGVARELVAKVQKMRQKGGLKMGDKVEIFVSHSEHDAALESNVDLLAKKLHTQLEVIDDHPEADGEEKVIKETVKIGKSDMTVTLLRS